MIPDTTFVSLFAQSKKRRPGRERPGRTSIELPPSDQNRKPALSMKVRGAPRKTRLLFQFEDAT